MKRQNKSIHMPQTVFSSSHRQFITSLGLSAACLSAVWLANAPEAFADDFIVPEQISQLEQETERQRVENQNIEQQIEALSAKTYPSPFTDSRPRLEESNFLPIVNENFGSETSRDSALSPPALSSTVVAQSATDIAQTTEAADTPRFGQAGKQRWYVQGGVGADFDDDLFGLVGTGVSHFVFDGHSINLELNGLAVDQQNNNAVGLNLALLVRSHWIRGDNWSIYIDGGAGLLTTNNDVPDAGSSFNFTPQIGGGATFAINDTQRIMTGLRWYHISNANTFEANPGLDALYGYVGYNFPF